MNRTVYKTIVIVTSLAISMAWAYHIYQKSTRSTNLDSFLNRYEMVDRFEKILSEPLVYKAHTKDGSTAFLVFEKEIGYQSEVVMASLISPAGTLLDARTLRHGESPPFYNKLYDSDFFSRFTGKEIVEGVKVGTNIDGVSGATISAAAAAKAVHGGMTFVGNRYLSSEVINLYSEIDFGAPEVAVLLMLLLSAVAYKTKNTTFRYVILFYSLAIMGFQFALFISYSYFFTLLTGSMAPICRLLLPLLQSSLLLLRTIHQL
jgi:NosR/NirI family nitrous oxide reductase transcriptional regulator